MSRKRNILVLLLAVVLLSGCSLRTLDDLYQVPRRSDEFNNLQSAIDRNLGALEYCAPQSGKNLQAVQMADLDGDGVQEYLLFAKGSTEKPLQILIFQMKAGEYVLADTIQSHGSAFDLVEYARMDDRPGFELIVGCQISEQVARSVCVYGFQDGKAVSQMAANYTKFITCDLTNDERSELLVLRPGESDEDNGLAELYQFTAGTLARSSQVSLSESADRLKRIEWGFLQSGETAVYVDMAVGASSVITDVFSVIDGQFTSITADKVQTLRNDYVYAEDIDSDGVVEIPGLIKMRPPFGRNTPAMQHLIRWYAISADAQLVDKRYTYHNLHSGWYITLNSDWGQRVAVTQQGSAYEFFVWNEDFSSCRKILTVYAFTGTDRKEQAVQDGRFAVYQDDSLVYAALLEEAAAEYGINQQNMINRFHLIRQDWKTQEVTK